MSTPTSHRVLMVTPGFPADEQDSLCIPPVQLMLRALAAQDPDLEVSVLALHYPPGKRKYMWHDFEVVTVGSANRRWPFRMIDLMRARRLAGHLHSERPFSHVHSLWLTDAALVASAIARSSSCTSSVTAMGQDVLPTNRYLRLLAHWPDQIVAISDRAGETFEQSTGRQLDTVIPWGIGPPPETLPRWGDRPIDLLGVGSLIEIKRWSLLLNVIQQLSDLGAPPRTVLVGAGPLRERLEAEVTQRGLGEHLTFTGELPRPEVLRLMENSRVLLHPSQFEGQGFVFAEALSRGMSIVSGPVGMADPSPRWQVTEPDGFASACAVLLNSQPPTEGLVLNPLENTVSAYTTLWGLDR